MRQKRFLALVLAMAMCATMLVIPTGAVGGQDISGHWANGAFARWSGYGIVNGDANGNLNPDAPITRGEFAVIYSKLLGLKTEAPNNYADLSGDEWYASYILKATAAGVMSGDGTNCNAMDNVTRQEAMVMTAIALGIKPVKKPNLDMFTDGNTVAEWAAGYVAAMIQGGIVTGIGDNAIAPNAEITRASVMVMLDNAIGAYTNEAGSKITGEIVGTVIVAAKNVTIQDATIKGNLIVVPGAARQKTNNAVAGGLRILNSIITGSTQLNAVGTTVTATNSSFSDVSVESRRSGFSMQGTSTANNISVAGNAAGATVSVGEGSNVNNISSDAPFSDITLNGTAKGVALSKDAAGSAVSAGPKSTASNLDNNAPGSSVNIAGQMATLTNGESAKGSTTIIQDGGLLKSALSNAPNSAFIAQSGAKMGDITMSESATGSAVVADSNSTLGSLKTASNIRTSGVSTTSITASGGAVATQTTAADALKSVNAVKEEVVSGTQSAISSVPGGATVLPPPAVTESVDPPVTPPTTNTTPPPTVVTPPVDPPVVPPTPSPTAATVTTYDELKAALANTTLTTITINGTIQGTATAGKPEDGYVVVDVTRPVTITGGTAGKIVGSVNVLCDGVTISNLEITAYGIGTPAFENLRNSINVVAQNVTITGCTFGPSVQSRLTNGISIFPYCSSGNPVWNFNISGNTCGTLNGSVPGWSSTGITISEGLELNAKFPQKFTASTKSATGVTISNEEAFAKGNTYTNCTNEYTHVDYTSGTFGLLKFAYLRDGYVHEYLLANADGDGTMVLDGTVNMTEGGEVSDGVTLKITGTVTVPTGKALTIASGGTLVIDAGGTLTVTGTLANNGTLTNNGTLGGTGTITMNEAAAKVSTGTAIATATFSLITNQTEHDAFVQATDYNAAWDANSTPATLPWIAVAYDRNVVATTVTMTATPSSGTASTENGVSMAASDKAFFTINTTSNNTGLAAGTYTVVLTHTVTGGLTTIVTASIVVPSSNP